MISNLGEDLERFYKEAQERGKKEGREEGIEKGKKENAIEVAKQLLLKGMATKDIAEVTKLSKEEVEKLKDNLK